MKKYTITHVFGIIGVLSWSGTVLLREMLLSDIGVLNFILGIMPNISASWVFMWICFGYHNNTTSPSNLDFSGFW